MRTLTITAAAIAGALVLGAAAPSWAADLTVKAAPPSQSLFIYPYNGSGFYWGLHSVSDGAVDSAGRGAFTTSGGAYGGTAGYQVGNGTSWLALELMASYSNAKGSDLIASTATKWSGEVRAKLGGNLASMISVLPNAPWAQAPIPALPPTSGAAPIMHPYLFAGAYARKLDVALLGIDSSAWRVSPTAGVGVMTQITGGAVVDVWGEYVSPSQSVGTPLGPVGAGQQYRVGMSLLF